MTSQAPLAQAFKPGSLYALLLYRGETSSWHWALLLPDEPGPPHTLTGTVWHCTSKSASARGRWTYEELSPDSLHLPERLVLAARLADLAPLSTPPDVAAELSLVLKGVPVRPDAHRSVFNCRSWVLDGIGELDDGGFLSCVSTMALEDELVTAALLATPKYKEDGSYVMITPRNCSDS